MQREPEATEGGPLPVGGTITAIVSAVRARGRFVVMVDGKPSATLTNEAIVRLGLVVGGSTIGREQALAEEEATTRLYDRALVMLTARARASRELERILVRSGAPPHLTRNAINRLESAGFLDDRLFARQFVRSKSLGSGFAKRRLEQELGRRGLDRGATQDAIREVFAEEQVDEMESACVLARKRVRAMNSFPPTVKARRLCAYLARRGYAPDTVAKAVALAIREVEFDRDDE